mgnify:CR=1 FL=1
MSNGYSTEYEAKIVGDIYAVRREVEKTYPPSRERSLALTKLDEAALWIKATPLEVHETDI